MRPVFCFMMVAFQQVGMKMKNLIVSAFALVLLAGCGGGSSGTAATPTPAPTPATVSAPAVSANAVPVGAANLTISGNAQDYLVKFAGTVDLTISAQIANVWIADNQVMGAVAISGGSNTIVFRPGATVQSLTVTGAANTIYLPVGSPIVVAGSGATMTTVKYYAP